MTKRLNVPTTKSSLVALGRQVDYLQQGHDMLEQKRELLTQVVYDRLARYRELRQEAKGALIKAYRALGLAWVRLGPDAIRQATLGQPQLLGIRLVPRSTVGVEYPEVRVHTESPQPADMTATDATFDTARRELLEAARLLADVANAETALVRLLEEQRKTQKRVNALKYNLIPRYRLTIEQIRSALEEEERNTLFQIKVLRERAGR